MKRGRSLVCGGRWREEEEEGKEEEGKEDAAERGHAIDDIRPPKPHFKNSPLKHHSFDTSTVRRRDAEGVAISGDGGKGGEGGDGGGERGDERGGASALQKLQKLISVHSFTRGQRES